MMEYLEVAAICNSYLQQLFATQLKVVAAKASPLQSNGSFLGSGAVACVQEQRCPTSHAEGLQGGSKGVCQLLVAPLLFFS